LHRRSVHPISDANLLHRRSGRPSGDVDLLHPTFLAALTFSGLIDLSRLEPVIHWFFNCELVLRWKHALC
jgi:hypothetical protein